MISYEKVLSKQKKSKKQKNIEKIGKCKVKVNELLTTQKEILIFILLLKHKTT